MITIDEVKEKTEERFWSKIKFGELNDCWEWQRFLDKDGYGIYKISALLSKRAHRFIFNSLNLLKNIKHSVLHNCDNPCCVNPNHLFEGTQKENMKDMVKKGRAAKGSKSGNSKLTEDHVMLIKMRLAIGETHRSIAKAFKISSPVVTLINRGEIWKHVQLN